jgi:hypothetical protein
LNLDQSLRELLDHYRDAENEAAAEGDEEQGDEARRRRAVLSGWIAWRSRQRNQREDSARARQRQRRR